MTRAIVTALALVFSRSSQLRMRWHVGPGVALTLVLAASLAQPAAAAAQEQPSEEISSDFTPLDEIDRVRREGCGLDRFETFLEWYTQATEAGGWTEQAIFTEFMVLVGKLDDPDGPSYGIGREEYLGQFRITYYDYLYGDRDPQARRVTLHRLNERTYRVDWQGGLGWAGGDATDRDKRAGAYIFEYKKDCWYLTRDLR